MLCSCLLYCSLTAVSSYLRLWNVLRYLPLCMMCPCLLYCAITTLPSHLKIFHVSRFMPLWKICQISLLFHLSRHRRAFVHTAFKFHLWNCLHIAWYILIYDAQTNHSHKLLRVISSGNILYFASILHHWYMYLYFIFL